MKISHVENSINGYLAHQESETENSEAIVCQEIRGAVIVPDVLKGRPGYYLLIGRKYEESKNDFQKINRTANSSGNSGKNNIYKQIIFVLIAIIIIFGFYLFNNKKEIKPVEVESNKNFWYSVKLINGEFYYGQIKNTGDDPVVLENVYYNYDQINSEQDENGEKKESGNLRLVKRGKETHGPDGSMSIVRTQVVYMEPLREDSKVLKAILDYEK